MNIVAGWALATERAWMWGASVRASLSILLLASLFLFAIGIAIGIEIDFPLSNLSGSPVTALARASWFKALRQRKAFDTDSDTDTGPFIS